MYLLPFVNQAAADLVEHELIWSTYHIIQYCPYDGSYMFLIWASHPVAKYIITVITDNNIAGVI